MQEPKPSMPTNRQSRTMPARTAQPRSPRRLAVLRCLIAAVLGVVLITGLAALTVWLVVRPKPIAYAVEHAAVRHFNATPPPGAALNATFYVTLAAYNPNRHVSLQYESVALYVLYGGPQGAQLAVADVPPFQQPRRNETRLSVRAVARFAPVADAVARELRHDQAVGTTSLDVRVRARVRFRVGLVRTRHNGMEVFCSPVVVGLSRTAAAFQRVACDVAISR